MFGYSSFCYSQINDNKMKFGMHIGGIYPFMFSEKALPEKAEIVNTFGFVVGVNVDYPIASSFLVSPKVNLSVCESKVTFSDTKNTDYKLMQFSFNFMADFVLKKWNSTLQPYLLIGPKYIIPIDGKNNDIDEYPSKSSYSLDFGIGFHKHLKKFSIAPEIRYSYGISDINSHPLLSALKYHSLSLVLNFKG